MESRSAKYTPSVDQSQPSMKKGYIMDAIISTVCPHHTRMDRAIEDAVAWLNDQQSPEGYWAGMLESNVCMEAEWILAMYILGVENDAKTKALKQGILDEQRPDGSWETYYRAPEGDINATVEAYAALRVCGMAPAADPIQRARRWILDHGGVSGVRVFTRYWLALIGEWPWEKTPNIPPEIIFLPRWFPFNIYNFACWARATILPLAILSAHRTVRPFPDASRLDELFPAGRQAVDYNHPKKGSPFSWERFFTVAGRILHLYQDIGMVPGRKTAIRACMKWIVAHQDADGAWGGIQPPWIYSLMALNVEGYPITDPVIRKGLDALNGYWTFEKNGALHVQASESPIWDTLLSLMAMQDCGCDYTRSPTMKKAVEWILEKEIRTPGDWQVKVKGIEPGGWAFQRANAWYPDIDDTAVALSVLGRLRHCYEDRQRLEAVITRATRWIIAMQCRKGGWGAFDRDNDKKILTRIPFCDFGEVLDPPSVDLAGRVIKALGELGMDRSHPVVRRAMAFIREEQEPKGCWFGRWGVNYIYGTAIVLGGLQAVGEDMQAGYVKKAADWVASRQNRDGGWGESCGSYMDPALRGKGESTPSQTGWAMMALLELGDPKYQEAIEDGVSFLIARQQGGTWDEPQYTGTGFPGYGEGQRIDLAAEGLSEKLCQGAELSRGFMINYNLYRHYFPLMALGRARRFLC
jgi:squalene-hopene/tetraprenyl-beta-curcumene cyclase